MYLVVVPDGLHGRLLGSLLHLLLLLLEPGLVARQGAGLVLVVQPVRGAVQTVV